MKNKFAVIFGKSESEIQKRAVEELSRILLECTLEYPICLQCGEDCAAKGYIPVYIGTKEDNPYIKERSASVLSRAEEYHIKVSGSSVIIEGFDDAGVLYGAIDFYNKYIVKYEYPNTDRYFCNFLESGKLPDFECSSAPSVRERGLWTWGHVIYDYRGYIDNMMRLKMNRLIIWNDNAPTNAADIVKYAHSRGIKIIFGFSWLWDTDCSRFDIKNTDSYSEAVFEKYENEYAALNADGIYFQTFTELDRDSLDGVIIAKAAAAFVNRTSAVFYKKYPHLEIQFGLHATSVRDRLEFIKTVDPRIRIVWENCGAFPFSYVPTPPCELERTRTFIKDIAALRGKSDRFGVVTKGLTKLDWTEFLHADGSMCIGVSSKAVKKNRIERKRRIWRYIQACWLTHSDDAYELVREMRDLKDGDLSIFALVEDGMFEENIMFPIALYSEMLWDCDTDLDSLIKNVALREYISFA